MPSKFLVSVDPGDVNNGFCFFKYDTETRVADTRIMEILTGKQLSEHLHLVWEMIRKARENDPTKEIPITFVVENFRVGTSRGAVFQWNEVLTARNIGKVEFIAESMNAHMVLQEPGSVLQMGRKWAPFKVNKGHIRDDHSAWIHGVYYMMRVNWFTDADSVKFFGQERL